MKPWHKFYFLFVCLEIENVKRKIVFEFKLVNITFIASFYKSCHFCKKHLITQFLLCSWTFFSKRLLDWPRSNNNNPAKSDNSDLKVEKSNDHYFIIYFHFFWSLPILVHIFSEEKKTTGHYLKSILSLPPNESLKFKSSIVFWIIWVPH